jgi:uncharacterized membrane protein YeaQ/YmgE (transglycosylase-associated protein family)
MGYLVFPLVVLAIMGLVPGFLARLLVPGRNPMGCMATWLLGFGGLILLGTLSGSVTRAIAGPELDDWWMVLAGMIGSIGGSVILLYAYRRFRRRKPDFEWRNDG